ncbi:chorismate-binding protein [Hydrogenibacillus schlegelii]|uniref:Chorismate-utilising enzyme C-terminal domain-containing protein n=1 Tax=Hydrogenibacillus schlegelii TaxID=1484 RepID=A0A179IQS1_HYDSH|nr:chorismate-binding protein [Hydrogenibacillus schlegelii]OAR04675.1 hypothetical protein SA87_09095 [Hydrogenibacillus schlegelii]
MTTLSFQVARFDFPGGPRIFARPAAELVAETPEEVPAVLAAVDAARRAGRWAVGFLTYEAGAAFWPNLPLPRAEEGGAARLPFAWFGLFESDGRDRAGVLPADGRAGNGPGPRGGAPAVSGAAPSGMPREKEPAAGGAPAEDAADGAPPPEADEDFVGVDGGIDGEDGSWPALLAALEAGSAPDGMPSEATWAAYRAAFSSLIAALTRGEAEVVNLTFRLALPLAGAGHATGDDGGFFRLYRRLLRRQGAGYGAFLDFGRLKILSASPELFFAWDGRTLAMRPMKGTAPRGRYPEEDARRRAALFASAKDRAELFRTAAGIARELAALAEGGAAGVRIGEPVLEAYPTVWQLTAPVEATTRPEVRLSDLFRALFPSGSIAGMPKRSALEIIGRLEQSPRGIYTGAIGMAGPDGAVFNVAIRTAVVDVGARRLLYGTGSGITARSVARREYREALLKAGILLRPAAPPPALVETMRLEDGAVFLEALHLARLFASMRHYGFPDRTADIRKALEAAKRRHPAGLFRLRLVVFRTGAVTADAAPLGAPWDDRRRLALLPAPDLTGAVLAVPARTPIDADDDRWWHKRLDRAPYEARLAEAAATTANAALPVPSGGLDVLLWNGAGRPTELSRANLVVERDGHLWTPPLSDGLLPGVFRAHLLAAGFVREAPMTWRDLCTADRLWAVNSVRGWMPLRLWAGDGDRPRP